MRVQYWHEIGEQVCRTEASVPATSCQVKLENLVFVDETGSNLAITRHYARSCRGSRAYNHAPYRRGQNVTLIGAMALRGLAKGNYFSWRQPMP